MKRSLLFGILFSLVFCFSLVNASVILLSNDTDRRGVESGLTLDNPAHIDYAEWTSSRGYYTKLLPSEINFVTGKTSSGSLFLLTKPEVNVDRVLGITKNDPITVRLIFPENYTNQGTVVMASGYFEMRLEGDLSNINIGNIEVTALNGYKISSLKYEGGILSFYASKFSFGGFSDRNQEIATITFPALLEPTPGVFEKVSVSELFPKTPKSWRIVSWSTGHAWDKSIMSSLNAFIGIHGPRPKAESAATSFDYEFFLAGDKMLPQEEAGMRHIVKLQLEYYQNYVESVTWQAPKGWVKFEETSSETSPYDYNKMMVTAKYKWEPAFPGEVVGNAIVDKWIATANVVLKDTGKVNDTGIVGHFVSPTTTGKENFLTYGVEEEPTTEYAILIKPLQGTPQPQRDGIGGTVEITRGDLVLDFITNIAPAGNGSLVQGLFYSHQDDRTGRPNGKGFSNRIEASVRMLSNAFAEFGDTSRIALYKSANGNDSLFLEDSANPGKFTCPWSDLTMDLSDKLRLEGKDGYFAEFTGGAGGYYYLEGENTATMSTKVTYSNGRPDTLCVAKYSLDSGFQVLTDFNLLKFEYDIAISSDKKANRVTCQSASDPLKVTYVDYVVEAGYLKELQFGDTGTGTTSFPGAIFDYETGFIKKAYRASFDPQSRAVKAGTQVEVLEVTIAKLSAPIDRYMVVSEKLLNQDTVPASDMSPYSFRYKWDKPEQKMAIATKTATGESVRYTYGYMDGDVKIEKGYNLKFPGEAAMLVRGSAKAETETVLEYKEVKDYLGRSQQTLNPDKSGTAYTYVESNDPWDRDSVRSTSTLGKDGSVIDVTNYTYTSDANPTSDFRKVKTTTSASGTVTEFIYDYEEATLGDQNGDNITTQAFGNVIKTIRAKGTSLESVVIAKYDDQSRLLETIDGEGMKTRNEYYNSGELGFPNLKKTIVDADRLNLTTEYTYDAWGNVLTVKDPKGNITTTEYDAQGKVTKTISPAPFNFQTLYLYDDYGRQSEVWVENKDKDGNLDPTQPWLKTRNVYDLTGRTKWTEREKTPGVWVPSNGETTYLPSGNVDISRDIFGVQTKYEYDNMNRNFKTTRAFGTTIATSTQTIFDPATGRVTGSIDGRGNTPATTEYDTFGRAYRTVDAFGIISETVYDTFGRTWKQQTWNAGHLIMLAETVNVYDALDRVCETQALWNEAPGAPAYITTSRQEFDHNGRVVRSWDANNNLTTTVYDTAGRVERTINALGHPTVYTYDANGNTIKVTDALGHESFSEYDNLNRLTASIDAENNRTEYYYDSRGNQVEVKDARGNSTKSRFDSLGRNYENEDAEGNITKSIYDDGGRLVSQIDARNVPTTFEYDELGRRKAVVDVYNNRAEYTYDLNGNQISATDKRGLPTLFTYDVLNRQTHVTNALGKFTKTDYDAQGRQIKFTNMRGKETQYAYDSLSRMISVTRTLNSNPIVTSYTYDLNGNRLTETNEAMGYTTSFQYDALNRVWKTIDAQGGESITTYNEVGNTWKVRDALNNETVFDYFNNNRQKTVTNAKLEAENYTYDANGNRLTLTNARGKITNFAYDKNNRVTTITDALNGISRKTYDPNGNVLTAVDAENNTTTFTYDQLNRELTKQDAINALVTKTYDANGNLVTIKDNNNNVTTYTYDALNRQSETLFADGTRIIRTFDDNGNVLTTTDQNGTIVTNIYDELDRVSTRNINRGVGVVGTTQQNFSYDALGRMTAADDNNDPADANDNSALVISYDNLSRVTGELQTIGGISHSVTNQFNLLNRTNLNYPGGKALTFQHDQLNRITNINQTQTIANYQYSATGRVSQKTLVNNTVMNVTHDDLDRETNRNHTSFGTTLISFENTHDKVGNKRYERRSWTGFDKGDFYSYDAIYRLTNVKYNVPGSELEAFKNSGTIPTTFTRQTDFGMDGVGNRTAVNDSQNGTTNYAINNMNEYTNINGTAKTNDEAGNLTDDGTKIFKWDFANRLREVYNKADGTLIVKYLYDARGRRVARISGTGGGQGAMQVATNKAITADSKNPQARAARINALQSKIRGLENALAQHLKNKPATNNTATPAPTPTAKGKSKLTAFVESQQAGASNNAVNNLTQELSQTYELLANELNLTGNCYWFYDGDEIVEQRDDADVLASSWVNGISIDERIEIEISGLKYYYHVNNLGTVYALTDSTGVMVERYEYDVYGKAIIYDPTLTIQRTYSIAGNFSLFTGRQLDYETGLYYYRARMYDANTGRFLSHDPLGYIDGMGLYVYVRNNPNNFYDFDGMRPRSILEDFSILELDRTIEQYNSGPQNDQARQALQELRALRTRYVNLIDEEWGGAAMIIAGGITTQLDTPAPGPADAVGAAMAITGIFVGAYNIFIRDDYGDNIRTAMEEIVRRLPQPAVPYVEAPPAPPAAPRVRPPVRVFPKKGGDTPKYTPIKPKPAEKPRELPRPKLQKTGPTITMIEKPLPRPTERRPDPPQEPERRYYVRFGNGPESVEGLKTQAELAFKSMWAVYGVSVKMFIMRGNKVPPYGKYALKETADMAYPNRIIQTGYEVLHYTVLLDNPVTKEQADKFNRVFPPRP